MSTLLELVHHYGLAFVFVNVLLLQVGLPVPAYPTKPIFMGAPHHRCRLVPGDRVWIPQMTNARRMPHQ